MKRKTAVLDKAHRAVNLNFANGLKEYMRMHDIMRDKGLAIVPFFKERLGRQQFCAVTGSENRRFYVWHTDEWLIYVHSCAGIQFCVFHPCTQKDERTRWHAFLQQVLTEDELQRIGVRT